MRVTQHSPFVGDDDLEPVEKIRKGRGRLAGYMSSNPAVRREVRLTGQTELRKVLRAARALKITFEGEETLAELRILAYEDYQVIAEHEGRRPVAFERMHPQNLDRITVNFLRHARTTYDTSLVRGRLTARSLNTCYNKELKSRILDLIAERHPELAAECERQRAKTAQTLEKAAEPLIEAGLEAAA